MASNRNNGKKLHVKREVKEVEETTFIVLILSPTDPVKDPTADPNLLAVLNGWCVIAAHGLEAAMGHVAKIDFDFSDGVDLRDATWKDVASGGKMTTLADGKVIQVLPAPLYIVEQKEPLAAYIM